MQASKTTAQSAAHPPVRPVIPSAVPRLLPVLTLLLFALVAFAALAFARPAAAQAPGGTFAINKDVAGVSGPVQPGQIFTYTVRVQLNGGSLTAPTVVVDELPPGVELAGPVQAQEEVANVQTILTHVTGRTVHWHGALSPGARVGIAIPVRVTRCFGERPPIVNTAKVIQLDGSVTTDSAQTPVQCPSGANVQVRKRVLVQQGGSLVEATETDAIPGDTLQMRFKFVNQSNYEVAVRLRDRLPEGMVTTHGGAVLDVLDILRRVPANGSVDFDFPVRIQNVDPAEGFSLVNQARYVVCPIDGGGDPVCAFPVEADPVIRQSNAVTVRVYAPDLGDAPDSTNHFGAGMAAYPGTPANFPTVYQPAAAPVGPRHSHARPFHLGALVSLESNADVGLDTDPTNNLIPPANTANQDRFDDGIQPGQLSFAHCSKPTIPVRVFIAPAAIAKLPGGKGYVNIWVDGNRDGDWADAMPCQTPTGAQETGYEHIVVDFPVDAAALGVGLHTINVPANLHMLWPNNADPAWLRVTLSGSAAPKPLNLFGVNVGDGRGPVPQYHFGETEDYLWRSPQDPGLGPDVAVRKRAAAHSDAAGNAQPFWFEEIRYVIDYRNTGDATATQVILTDDLADAGDLAQLSVLAVPLVDIERNGATVTFDVGDLDPGEGGRIFIRTGVGSGVPGDTFTNRISAGAAADVDPANNEAEAAITLALPAPRITGPRSGITCDGDLTVRGRAYPGSEVGVLVDGAPAGSTTADAQGRWSLALTLSPGEHILTARAKLGPLTSDESNSVQVTVDPLIGWSPLSLTFTGPNGAQVHPVDPNGFAGTEGLQIRLRRNTQYQIALRVCCAGQATVTLEVEGHTANLTDPDQDGLYTGSVTTPAQHTDGELTISVTCGSSTSVATGAVLVDPDGVVSDALTGAPLAGAAVACAVGEGNSFSLWPAADYGQVNPQTTGADGYFSFFTPPGTYRIEASKAGYQPYRSPDLVVAAEPVRHDVPLMPEPPAAADAAAQAGAEHTVVIGDAGFEPAYLKVQPGDVVRFVNLDLAGHTVSAAGPLAFDSGLLLGGERFAVELSAPGTLTVGDALNAANAATIVVEPAAALQNPVWLPVIGK